MRRAWAFGRHMPVSKLLRRIGLTCRRRISVQAKPSLSFELGEFPLSQALPGPLLAPREGLVRVDSEGWHFQFLGRGLTMPEAINWNALDASVGNQLWRMNLHYMEYLEALDPQFARAAVLSWIEGNPPWRPGYWRDSWNSYTLSLRVVVWMQQFGRIAPTLNAGDRIRIVRSLAQQMMFLERNLETDLGGNHLMKNIKALLWASVFFDGPHAQRWRRRGLSLLRCELDAQILRDGVHYERSPSYHAQVFADLLEIRQTLGQDPFHGELDRVLAAMGQAAADLAHPDGGPVLFNDAGLTMAYGPQACLSAMSVVLGKQAGAPATVFSYPQAGYFGLRSADTYLVVDFGRIGPDDLPAHAHADVGTFELSVAGERLIVDQGVFEYIDGTKRALSRSTAAHNTFALDGTDQAEMFGSFRCGRRPNVTVRMWTPREEGFLLEGVHDGYAHLPGRPIVARRIEADAECIRVRDWIEGLADHPAVVGLLLHPDAKTTLEAGDVLVARGNAAVRISAVGNLAIESAVYWPDMGVERPTKRVRIFIGAGLAKSEIVIRRVRPTAARL